MSILIGLVVFPILFYLPGYLFSFWSRSDWLGRQYEIILSSSLLTGWVAFILAEIGWFSLPLLGTIILIMCGGAFFLRKRYPNTAQPLQELGPRWERWIYIGTLLCFALIVSRPFEIILGGRDAGVYPNTGYAIARTGGIVQYEPQIAQIGAQLTAEDQTLRDAAAQVHSNLLGVQDRERFIATRFPQSGFFINDGEITEGRVVPQFFHLYAVWIAIWTSLFGLYGGLISTGFLGWLAIWSIAMTARALFPGRRGTLAGVLTLVLLALNSLQIWFSRYSTSEALAQMLLWAGLAMWVRFASLEQVEKKSSLGIWYGGLTGFAMGQLILTRIDFFWGIGPLLLVLVWAFLRRHWSRGHTAMAVTLGAMIIHGGLHILLIARSYFFDTAFAKFQDTSALVSRLARPFYTPLLQEVWVTNNRSAAIYFNTGQLLTEIALLVVAIIFLLALRRWPKLLTRIQTQIKLWQRPLTILLATSIILIASYAYFIRPQIITSEMIRNPFEQQLAWQGYIGAPIAVPDYGAQQQRAVVLANLVRFGWYLSPLGIILGVIGLAGWVTRDLNRSTWLVVLICLTYGITYIRDTYGTADQTYIYIARRFLSGSVPAFVLGIAWILTQLFLHKQRLWRSLGLALTAGLCLFYMATGWRAVQHVEYAGALESISELAEQFEDNAIIIVRGGDRDAPSNIATPLRYTFDQETFVAWSTNPLLYREQLATQIRLWQQQGHPVYLMLGTNGGIFNLPGFEYQDQGLWSLTLAEWQQLQNQKPFTAGEITLAYRIYKLEPSQAQPNISTIQLEVSDYQRQLRGFYPVEYNQANEAYVWTSEQAELLIPATPTSSTLELQLGLGIALPPSLENQPVELCPYLHPLTQTEPQIQLVCQYIDSKQAQPYQWEVPALPSTIAQQWTLTLASRTWTPNTYATEYPTPPNDGRNLGLQWFGGRIINE